MNNKQLQLIYPASKNASRIACLKILDSIMNEYHINTLNRKRTFISQLGHECAQLTTFVENLNYSSEALCTLFKKYFPNAAIANIYARNPEKIANHIYANRNGNGNETSGDGWKYRGRGAIQITGKDNYKLVSNAIGIDFVSNPKLLESMEFALKSAAWWWNNAGLNELADTINIKNEKEVFQAITRKVNGGLNGYDDRYSIYQRTKKYLV